MESLRFFLGFERVAEHLIRGGIDLNYTMSNGQTALMWTTRAGISSPLILLSLEILSQGKIYVNLCVFP